MSSDNDSSKAKPPHRVCLVVRDGWGYSAHSDGNAIAQANTPHTDRISQHYHTALLDASGTTVGLPEGDMGNSEVGHLTMGAGRSEPQELMRIEKAISDGSFNKIDSLVEALNMVKGENGKSEKEGNRKKGKENESERKGQHKLHLLGLVSDGGIHSHINHLFTLLQCCKDANLPADSVYVHCITDGRDTPPTSAPKYVKQLTDKMAELGIGRLADVIGRHYAMDRDKRWDRLQTAYDLYTQSKGETVKVQEIDTKLQELYKDKKVDDQTIPALLVDESGVMCDGDVVICFNFRNDRAKEMTAALTAQGEDTTKQMKLKKDIHLHVVTMTQYDESFKGVPVMFPFHPVEHSLPYVVSEAGLRQFHVAETEKYAHVTFFFSGGKEQQVKGETRKLIPSPHVDTYDQQPEMSMRAVGDEVVKAIESGQYELIVCNLAGADMVGHTGKYEETVKACECVDEVVGKIVEAIEKTADDSDDSGDSGDKQGQQWVMLLTGDHGNAEEMKDENGEVKTSHTTNPVQFHIIGKEWKQQNEGNEKGGRGKGKDSGKGEKRQKLDSDKVSGGLNDVAPTILELLGLKKPKEMTGKSLLPK